MSAVHRGVVTGKRGQNLCRLWNSKIKENIKESRVQHFSGYGKLKEEVARNTAQTLGEKIATAFWAPKATKSQAPQETLFTILLQPAPMNTPLTSTSPPPPPEAMFSGRKLCKTRWRPKSRAFESFPCSVLSGNNQGPRRDEDRPNS